VVKRGGTNEQKIGRCEQRIGLKRQCYALGQVADGDRVLDGTVHSIVALEKVIDLGDEAGSGHIQLAFPLSAAR
jgi:hypothetical protein